MKIVIRLVYFLENTLHYPVSFTTIIQAFVAMTLEYLAIITRNALLKPFH